MIRTMFKLVSAVLVVVAIAALPGCGGSGAPADKKPDNVGHHEGDGHDHSHSEGDGHDHSKHKH